MSQTAISTKNEKYHAGAAQVDLKLEVAVIPVSDVDRAKEFYTRLGWRLDSDDAMGNEFRLVQLTPPGSGRSITFGKGITIAAPGSLRGALIVSDIEVAYKELVAKAINVSEVFHGSPFSRISGPEPERKSTVPSSPSKIPTAICGSSRRLRAGCLVAWTPRRRALHQQAIWQVPSSALPPPTTSTSRETGTTRTGRTGAQRTWLRNKLGPSCRGERAIWLQVVRSSDYKEREPNNVGEK
jgi:hypothetical protein